MNGREPGQKRKTNSSFLILSFSDENVLVPRQNSRGDQVKEACSNVADCGHETVCCLFYGLLFMKLRSLLCRDRYEFESMGCSTASLDHGRCLHSTNIELVLRSPFFVKPKQMSSVSWPLLLENRVITSKGVLLNA